ncbi:hypothetical protein Psch_01688 [Pelotomaculum schinkii]|uniref:Uncharacterized protein n=1 Tax=Pelotomaculum schinkii TaxID=78350 RepID=A0A4Y7RH66_9FIRM|nr:hypothetical protein Psch_01688 [Pelotomaculum schinkii]TEB15078.1 hypothetical protein Psfp_02397 [Pelotomaculum sp. FP]
MFVFKEPEGFWGGESEFFDFAIPFLFLFFLIIYQNHDADKAPAGNEPFVVPTF